MKLKDSELKNILAEVERDIASLLKADGDALRKAADDEGSEDAAPAESAPESAPAEASAPAESEQPEGSAPAGGDAPPAEASAPAPAADPAADPAAAAGPVDPEALKAEYSKLDPESLKAHYMAAKAALFEVMGAAQGGAPAGAGAPPPMAAGPEASAPPAPMPPPEASAPVPPPAFKAEIPASLKKLPANGGLKEQAPAVPDAIKKSESDSKIEDLEKQVELMAKALDLALGTPIRKAVTSVAHLPKTDEGTAAPAVLTKDEIKGKIRRAVQSGKLSKSQKDSIFSYTLGNVSFDSIKDLLETK